MSEDMNVKKFGTFSGVLLPSILTILGAVMYYIAPQIVGSVGIVKTILIILIAHSVTIATAFSISSIATNINVKSGGLYYLISRSLGSEFGGSLGIHLYLAQTIASAFYSIAFARGIVSILSSFGIVSTELTAAFVSILFFGLLVYIGAHFVVKIQYIIFGALLLSLASIFLGPNPQTLTLSIFEPSSISFWIAFAMFFPAVTGIDAGVGMSGDLKDPRKSLVKGTFAAIGITMVVYIALTIKYAMSAPAAELVSNPVIVEKIAIFSPLVLVGILMATSSSALSSLMTAPRALTAMVNDGILPSWLNFLKKTIGKSREPRIAIIFTLVIAIAVLLAGPLEFVSQIVSMFFLSVYGWINGAAFFEKISQNPSYRPLFNTPAYISFYGMFAAYAIMYLFNPFVMVIGIVFQIAIFLAIYKSKKSMKFENVWDGVFFQLLRTLMKRIIKSEKSKKNWRPTIIAFCANDLNKAPLANLLHWIGYQRSITKMYFLAAGDVKKDIRKKRILEESLNRYVRDNQLDIFPRVVMNEDYEGAISTLVQSESIGDLPLNTVLIDFDNKIKLDEFVSSIVELKKNVIILRNQSGFSNFKKVDVWWNTEKNGNFMILLAYLITHSSEWLRNGAVIRLMKVVEKEEDFEKEGSALQKILDEARIENIETHILIGKPDNLKAMISENSEHSDLVILGIPNFSDRESDKEVVRNIESYTKKLKVSLIVYASDRIDFRMN